MARTFSLPSNALSYYIGYSLVTADRVAFVSPWISDVEIRLPITDTFDDRQTTLTDAIKQLDGETEVLVYIRSGQEHNNYVQSNLSDNVEVQSVDDLHAKAVVTAEHVYVGSANITRGGLVEHREICQIVENEYGEVETYITEELEL